jgi:hypothetical protein
MTDTIIRALRNVSAVRPSGPRAGSGLCCGGVCRMTQIDKEAVERLGNWLALNAPPEHIDAYNSLHAALDAAEAEKRAAVAAAYEKAKEVCQLVESAAGKRHRESGDDVDLGYVSAATVIKRRIDALSGTDALAEYVEKVRAEERERCLQLVEEYRQRAEARAEVTRGVGKHDATKGHEGQAAAAVSIAAAIRQETNDG